MSILSRRSFLKTSAGTTALVLVVSQTPAILAAEDFAANRTIPTCLRITNTGQIMLCVPSPDMGQGMMTTAAQLIAEEFNLNLEAVSVEFMPFIGVINDEGRASFDKLYQGAGGSQSTMRIWNALRQTAAHGHALLLEAAANHWRVNTATLQSSDGTITNPQSGETLAFSDLIDAAQNISLDQESITPKSASDYTVIGSDARNVAAHDIVTGKPIFALDVDVPNMVHAVIRRCPHLNGKLVSVDDTAARKMAGVKDIIALDRYPEDLSVYRVVAAGVAVVADTYWQAKQAAEALEIIWDGSISEADDTRIILKKCHKLLQGSEFTEALKTGDVETALDSATTTVDVTYTHPTWAHTNMEPHNCIADVRDDSADIWVGHQFMDAPPNIAKTFAGIDPRNVTGHFYRMGTGLGRKSEDDYIAEAVILSKKMKAPVKVTWSREDEIEQDFPNLMGAYRVRAGLNDKGELASWHIRTALDSGSSVCAKEFPTGLLEHTLGETAVVPNNISRGAWRGPSHNTAAWVIQSALDEAAHIANRDPLEFLIDTYKKVGKATSPNWPRKEIDYNRHVAVLTQAAEKANYGQTLPKGWGRGIAVYHTFVAVCAHVVDVEMTGDNDFKIHKVTSAIDCGLVVNPLGVKAQVESGIIDGICAAKYGNMVFERGVPITNNFDTYQKLRMNEAPSDIDIHLLDMGDTEPRGTGEVALPPIIPALTNAIYAASGKRVRTLPISENL